MKWPFEFTREAALEMLRRKEKEKLGFPSTVNNPDIDGFNRKIEKWKRRHPGELFNLRGSYLKDRHLSQAHFSQIDFSRAQLNNSDISGSLKNSNFTQAQLLGTIFIEVTDLNPASLKGAEYDDATKLPDYINPKKCGMIYKGLNLVKSAVTPAEPEGEEVLQPQSTMHIADANSQATPHGKKVKYKNREDLIVQKRDEDEDARGAGVIIVGRDVGRPSINPNKNTTAPGPDL